MIQEQVIARKGGHGGCVNLRRADEKPRCGNAILKKD
jgi:hypothetical protein